MEANDSETDNKTDKIHCFTKKLKGWHSRNDYYRI